MSEEERLQLENELLMTCSKAQAINKYIDELEESSKLSELWCKSQQENKLLKERIEYLERSIARKEDTIEGYIHETVELDEYKEVIDEAKKLIDAHLDGQFSLEPDYAPDFHTVDMLNEIYEILNKIKEK